MLTSLPNVLTCARIVIVPLVVVAMLSPGLEWRVAALALFVAAAATDWFDGRIARARAQTTRLGQLLDPMADKVLVVTVLVLLVGDGALAGVHIIAVLVILARELLVSGLRESLAGDGVTLPSSKLAKWKTTIQMAAVAVLIIAPETGAFPGPAFTLVELGQITLWLAAGLTIWSGAPYVRTGVAHLIGRDRAARADHAADAAKEDQ